jgi:hypothetical protein
MPEIQDERVVVQPVACRLAMMAPLLRIAQHIF